MATEERLLRLENAFTTLAELASRQSERTDTLEQSFQMLVELTRNMDERLDQHLEWINQLGVAQVNSEAKLATLAEAQAHSDQRLDALIDIVREWRNGKS